MTPEQRTIAFYDQNATSWVASHGGSDRDLYWAADLDRFAALLPSGSILEIGSGGGRAAGALITQGYQYTGIDPSAGLLAIAQAANPAGTFLNRSAIDLGFPDVTFDGCWAAASLLHLPKFRLAVALGEIHRVLRPGAICFTAMKRGDGEREFSDGRWFAYYQPAEFSAFLDAAGLATIEQRVWATERDIWIVTFAQP